MNLTASTVRTNDTRETATTRTTIGHKVQVSSEEVGLTIHLTDLVRRLISFVSRLDASQISTLLPNKLLRRRNTLRSIVEVDLV